MPIKESELILNQDGSVYHLNLKPADIADTIIFVGDQDRVAKISKHFDTIEIKKQKREFKTHTGLFRGIRLTVISTGIGPDNIDIVMNELDALVNVDLETRKIKKELTSLNIIRIGTSGSLQSNIPVDAFVLSTHGMDLNGMLHFYDIDGITNPRLEKAFVEFTNNEACNEAYLKMNNALVDDRRIKVDFSQSVANVWDRYNKRYRRGDRNIYSSIDIVIFSKIDVLESK